MTYIPVALRQRIHELAKNRCEYCLIPDQDSLFPHEIDHIYAEKHDGETAEDNLCLSCWVCNRHKGSDLTSLDPLTKQITELFHPRKDRWEDHFSLDGAVIVTKTPQGRVTAKLLQLNRYERVDERKIMIELGIYP